jgi:dolichol-phosphate mannosyltransferase
MNTRTKFKPSHLQESQQAELGLGLVSIVVPTYQEAENLGELITRIGTVMERTGRSYEVIVVDDDSGDGTQGLIEQLACAGFSVRLITRVGERGLSSAVIRGFQEARGELLICMDADLSHPPEEIPTLLEYLCSNKADFVLGSRYVKGASTDVDWGLFRRFNSVVATLMARPFTRVKDPMSGFFALHRQVLEVATELNPVGYKIGLELMVKCNCKRIYEIPIHFADRKRGKSKLSLKEQLNYLKHLKRLGDYKFGPLSQFFQFCFVGGTGMVVDLSIFAGLLRFGVPLMLGRALAIWIAMTWNFLLNRRITFSTSRSGSIFRQYARFVPSCGLGAIVSWSVSMILIAVLPPFQHQVMTSAIVGIAAGTLSNFTLSRLWVFSFNTPNHRETIFRGVANRKSKERTIY